MTGRDDGHFVDDGRWTTDDEPSGGGATAARVWTAASVEKAGMRPQENEDAIGVAARADGGLTLAVADGATESAFARAWARTLVAEAAADDGASSVPEPACAARRRSIEEVEGPSSVAGRPSSTERPSSVARAHARARMVHAAMLDARRASLPWYAAEKADAGAHAALVVVTVGPGGEYRAEAVGDACLFEVDAAGRRVAAWPLDTPEAFAARPVLLASTGAAPDVLVRTGRIPTGGALLVCTDALAAHLLARPAAPWPVPGDPADAAVAARAAGMRNDDVAWAVVGRAGSGR